jgi:flagellar motility protein MotE (MotC chaperone)
LSEATEIRRKPVNKKLIIITSALGLLSFAGAFAFSWFTKPSPTDSFNDPNQPLKTFTEGEIRPLQSRTKTIAATDSISVETTKSLTEQQLKNLIHDLRKKMRDYDNKLHALKVEEQRLQMAQNVLKEDIEKLHNLQIQLTSITANLKSERDKLLKSRLEIDKNEQTNLASIAATYDKMEASSASKIITNMCSNIKSKTGQNEKLDDTDGSFDDAVKILYFMTERTKAKLLAELAISEPELAAVLSQRLKQIVEVN